MRTARLAGMVAISIVVIGIATTSAATALPEYNTTKVKLIAATGIVELRLDSEVDLETIYCEKSVFGGEIVTKFLVGPLRLHFSECKSPGPTKGCTIKSVGAPEGLILTDTLHGFLVLQQLHGGPHVAWWLLLPITGKEIASLAKSQCSIAGDLDGQLGGEVAPLKRLQVTEKLLFTAAGQEQAVGETFEGGEVGTHEYQGLSFFGTSTTVEAEASIIFSKLIEVT
jgi:hypothetical protein